MNLLRLAVPFFALALGGCSKVSVENYDKLKVGMTYSEVKQHIGEPSKCDEVVGVRNCLWGDEAKHIKVSLAADRAVVFSAKGLK